MARDGVDGLLLGGDGAGAFAGGHRRIGVHMPGWPIPMTVVTMRGAPHVITADPDGAEHLPPAHVHPLIWNPASLVEWLPGWLGDARSGVIGVDMLSPGGMELARAALPEARFIDATMLLASARLMKSPDEQKILREACALAHEAARAGLRSGRGALQAALQGQFVASPPVLGEGRARVSVLVDSFLGEARLGPGDAKLLRHAAAELRPGHEVDEIAPALDPRIEVVGLGRGYEHPVIRRGRSAPRGLRLEAGAVLLVGTPEASVTVEVRGDGAGYLSPEPEEVVR